MSRQNIQKILKYKFQPQHLEVLDQSARHAGHREAVADGGGHFTVVIVSERFAEKKPLERHRMVYAALTDVWKKQIHALAIQAFTPQEWLTRTK